MVISLKYVNLYETRVISNITDQSVLFPNRFTCSNSANVRNSSKAVQSNPMIPEQLSIVPSVKTAG